MRCGGGKLAAGQRQRIGGGGVAVAAFGAVELQPGMKLEVQRRDAAEKQRQRRIGRAPGGRLGIGAVLAHLNSLAQARRGRATAPPD
jgi:hypothetical protein